MSTIFTEKEHGLIQVALYVFMQRVAMKGDKDEKVKIKELQKLLSKNAKFCNKDGKL